MTRPAAMSERSWGLWVATWRGLGAALRPLPYYPLWEVELYGVLLEQIDDIAAIFRHYAAGPPGGEITSGPPAGAPLATGFEDIQLSKEEWAGLLVDCGLQVLTLIDEEGDEYLRPGHYRVEFGVEGNVEGIPTEAVLDMRGDDVRIFA